MDSNGLAMPDWAAPCTCEKSIREMDTSNALVTASLVSATGQAGRNGTVANKEGKVEPSRSNGAKDNSQRPSVTAREPTDDGWCST